MDERSKRAMIDQVPFWFHSIDFGNGIVSPGLKAPQVLQSELEGMKLPPLQGKTVLDIGAWDGFFSFAAERQRAQRVVALDYHVWNTNLPLQQTYWRRCAEENAVPCAYHRVPGVWQPGTLPGKAGFDVAHRILGSKVEQIVADFMTANLEDIGSFDVVFFLGVLYHLEEPLRALKRLALLTRELAIVETAAIHVAELEDQALFEFYKSNELNHDVGNWWAPNLKGLIDCLLAAGFRRVEAVSKAGSRAVRSGKAPGLSRYRLTVHAWR